LEISDSYENCVGSSFFVSLPMCAS